MDKRRIAVVIVNYRTPDLVTDCLHTVVPELDARDLVVVVDNDSGDDSAEILRSRVAEHGWSSVHVVESGANAGFSAGNNAGIASARAEAYLLLNSDTLVRPNAIDRLWKTLQSDDRFGAVSPRLEWPDGTPQISCFRPHTPWSELINASGTGPIRQLLDRWDVPIPVSDQPSTPGWTSFAAVLIRAEVLDEVGPLDERFFMFYEDADYCRRILEAGWIIRNEPTARIVHLRGGTSPVKALKAAGKRRPRYYYRSRRLYFLNAYGVVGLGLANLCWTLGRLVSWTRETFGRKRRHTVEEELRDVWSLQ